MHAYHHYNQPKNIPLVFLNDKIILMNTSVKYLGLHLDKRLTRATCIKTKRKSLNFRLYKLRQLHRTKMSVKNKTFIHKRLLRPAMTYGIQPQSTIKHSNLKILQSFHSIKLRFLASVPWYVSNRSWHHDLNVLPISTLASYNYNKFHKNAINHSNPLITNQTLTTLPDNPFRGLKRKWSRD